MFNPKEELELNSKWWHKLIRIIVWLTTAFVFLATLMGGLDGSLDSSIFFNPLIIYLLLTFFYRYIILYIIYS
jgi:hypothetical protein